MFKKTSPTISFRLAPTFFKELTRQAEERCLSVGELARELVVQALTRESMESIREEIQNVVNSIQSLREGQLSLTAELLMNAGKMNETSAVEWVRENLL